MEKISTPWKTVKGTWNSSLLKKIKSFGKMELRSCLKNGRSGVNRDREDPVALISQKPQLSAVFIVYRSSSRDVYNGIHEV